MLAVVSSSLSTARVQVTLTVRGFGIPSIAVPLAGGLLGRPLGMCGQDFVAFESRAR